jgi:hypothetical protein
MGAVLCKREKRGRSLPGGDTIGITQIRGVGEALGPNIFHWSNQDGSMAPAYMPCHIYSTASEPSCHFPASCIALCLNKRTLSCFSHYPEMGSGKFYPPTVTTFLPQADFYGTMEKIVRKSMLRRGKFFPGRSLLWVFICRNLSCLSALPWLYLVPKH